MNYIFNNKGGLVCNIWVVRCQYALAIVMLMIFSSVTYAEKNWRVTDISLQYPGGSDTWELYANGRMQAPVVIGYKTADISGKPNVVPPSEMIKYAKLWDKFNNNDLNDSQGYSVSNQNAGWNNVKYQLKYYTERDEYNFNFMHNDFKQIPGWQYITLYADTTSTQIKTICVVINNDHTGHRVSTCGYDDTFDHILFLKATPPIRYGVSDLEISGRDSVWDRDKSDIFHSYITAKNGYNLYDYELIREQSSFFVVKDIHMRGAMGHRVFFKEHGKQPVHFQNLGVTMWKPRAYHNTVSRDVLPYEYYGLKGMPTHIEINKRSGSINLTTYRLHSDCGYLKWNKPPTNYNNGPLVIFFDEFGNSTTQIRLAKKIEEDGHHWGEFDLK